MYFQQVNRILGRPKNVLYGSSIWLATTWWAPSSASFRASLVRLPSIDVFKHSATVASWTVSSPMWLNPNPARGSGQSGSVPSLRRRRGCSTTEICVCVSLKLLIKWTRCPPRASGSVRRLVTRGQSDELGWGQASLGARMRWESERPRLLYLIGSVLKGRPVKWELSLGVILEIKGADPCQSNGGWGP